MLTIEKKCLEITNLTVFQKELHDFALNEKLIKEAEEVLRTEFNEDLSDRMKKKKVKN